MRCNTLTSACESPFDIGDGLRHPDAAILATGQSPADVYDSEGRFAAEKAMFERVWLYLCRGDEMPNPGDYRVKTPLSFGPSMLLVRGRDKVLRAFHNVCAHRGMKLVWNDEGSASQIRCPYHSWTYNLDGSLRWIPDQACFTNVDRDTSRLRPIAVEEWNGLVFFNLDANPSIGLAEYLGGYGELLAKLPLTNYKAGARFSGRIKADWKLGIEANNESYHVHILHSRTLRSMVQYAENPFSRPLSYDFSGPHSSCVIPYNNAFAPDPAKPVQFFAFLNRTPTPEGAPMLIDHPGVNRHGHEHWLNDLITFFPNVVMTVQHDSWTTFQFWPIGPGECRFETSVYARPARTPREEFALQHYFAFGRDVLFEDYMAMEQQQDVMGARAYPFFQLGGGDSEILLRRFSAVMQAIFSPGGHAASVPIEETAE